MTPDPFWTDGAGQVTLYLGDCIDVLRGLPENSIDACVTDPPYALNFMGRSWDDFGRQREYAEREGYGDKGILPGYGRGGRNADVARYRARASAVFQEWCTAWAVEALRVLKPGGYLLAFGGTRTWHRLTCGIEDAGFEIRDSVADLTGQDAPGLMWIHGQGFPKSRDIGKDIDRIAGAEREVIGPKVFGDGTKGHWAPSGVYAQDEWTKAQTVKVETSPATEDAKRWDGYGTALKPAWEPIVVARKPLGAGSVAGNVLEWGTGALNIAACKVGSDGGGTHCGNRDKDGGCLGHKNAGRSTSGETFHAAESETAAGRWPTNLVLTHDARCEPAGTRRVRGSSRADRVRDTNGIPSTSFEGGVDGSLNRVQSPGYADADGLETVEVWSCVDSCPVAELDRQSGVTTSGNPSNRVKYGAHVDTGGNEILGRGLASATPNRPPVGDTGGASRFYPVFRYQAKAPTSERPRLDDGSAHETVKPLELARWMCRLVCPPGGTVLDMFCGSGVIGEAAIIEGFRAVLIDQDLKSVQLTRKRLGKPIQPVMFGL